VAEFNFPVAVVSAIPGRSWFPLAEFQPSGPLHLGPDEHDYLSAWQCGAATDPELGFLRV
jgi:hypothetical protein